MVDPDKRMTASECLEHSWILDTEDNTSRLELLVDGSQTILTFSSGSLLPSSGGANTPTRSGRSTGSGPARRMSEEESLYVRIIYIILHFYIRINLLVSLCRICSSRIRSRLSWTHCTATSLKRILTNIIRNHESFLSLKNTTILSVRIFILNELMTTQCCSPHQWRGRSSWQRKQSRHTRWPGRSEIFIMSFPMECFWSTNHDERSAHGSGKF